MNNNDKHVLICTLGTTWAVVPEIVGAIAPSELPLYRHHPDWDSIVARASNHKWQCPDEIWVATSAGTGDTLRKLNQWAKALPADLVVRAWQIEDHELGTSKAVESFREMVFRLFLHASDRFAVVMASLAGGRKTMSADCQHAAHVFGCDGLFHVVDCGRLPDVLRDPEPLHMTKSLPKTLEDGTPLVACVSPIYLGARMRHHVLDIATSDLPRITREGFPLPVPDQFESGLFKTGQSDSLWREVEARLKDGASILGNYLTDVTKGERHENWRSLYRLPPQQIDFLRAEPLKTLTPYFRSFPKSDLHCHLGGALHLDRQIGVGQNVWEKLPIQRRERAWKQVKPWIDGGCWPENWSQVLKELHRDRAAATACLLANSPLETIERMLHRCEPEHRPNKQQRFASYEKRGDLSGSALLCEPLALEPYARAVITYAETDKIHYLELRGSPNKYRPKDPLGFVSDLYDAFKGSTCTIKFVIIVDRRQKESEVASVVDMACKAHQQWPYFVAGIDLAGEEQPLTSPERFQKPFENAFRECLPITIHAGEGEDADMVWEASYRLHADRIGHGLSLVKHSELMNRFRNRRVCIELCPSSNSEIVGFQRADDPTTNGLPEYPLKEFWDNGLAVTLCTDNPGMSQTDMSGEFIAAAELSPKLTAWDGLALIKQGFTHAFLPIEEKEEMVKNLDSEFFQVVTSCLSELMPSRFRQLS